MFRSTTETATSVLLDKVLPQTKWEDYRRALCILDPYGLHLDWKVIAKAGSMGSVDIFLNFPVADINRNVLRRDRKGVSTDQVLRMNRFWGDDSWKQVAYQPSSQAELWGPPAEEKASNEAIAHAFRKRLKRSRPALPMFPSLLRCATRKTRSIYYLYFASQKPVAARDRA